MLHHVPLPAVDLAVLPLHAAVCSTGRYRAVSSTCQRAVQCSASWRCFNSMSQYNMVDSGRGDERIGAGAGRTFRLGGNLEPCRYTSSGSSSGSSGCSPCALQPPHPPPPSPLACNGLGPRLGALLLALPPAPGVGEDRAGRCGKHAHNCCWLAPTSHPPQQPTHRRQLDSFPTKRTHQESLVAPSSQARLITAPRRRSPRPMKSSMAVQGATGVGEGGDAGGGGS